MIMHVYMCMMFIHMHMCACACKGQRPTSGSSITSGPSFENESEMQ